MKAQKVKRSWPWSWSQNAESELTLTIGSLGSHLASLGHHCLQLEIQGVGLFASALNSNKLYFYKEMELSVISPTWLDQLSMSILPSGQEYRNRMQQPAVSKIEHFLFHLQPAIMYRPHIIPGSQDYDYNTLFLCFCFFIF